jgi:hypothetical protein
MKMLNVYEFDASVQPGATANHFEVYDEDEVVKPLFYAETLDKAVKFCYTMGDNFTIHTLQAYYKEFGEE